ncbi:unnamed protein product [Urochloa humidicola]
MFMLLSSTYLAQGEEDVVNCFPFEGNQCDDDNLSCDPVCKQHGYKHGRCAHPPVGKGGNRVFCCCDRN